MSTDPTDRPALVARFRDAYEPTEADADRVLAKINASLVAESDAAPPPRRLRSRTLERLGLSSIAMAVIAGGVFLYQTRTERPPATMTAVPTTTTAAAPVPASSAATSSAVVAPSPAASAGTKAEVPAVSVDALPSSPPRRPAVTTAHSTVPVDDSLEREARLIADARRALQAGDPDRALALLDEHAQRFPKGFLSSDRAAERIDVLCRLGRRDDAVREAQAFLGAHPRTPLAHRVKTSCAGQ